MPNVIPTPSARRYAEAAYAVAGEQGDYDAWLAALTRVAELLRAPLTRLALLSPAVSDEQKLAVIDELAPPPSPHVRNFLRILVDRGRLEDVEGIATAFQERLNRERGIVTAEVTTAVPLDAQLERTIAERLGSYLQHDPSRIVIQSRVDPNIIGGVIARVGDILIDDSVRGRLSRLQRTLATGSA